MAIAYGFVAREYVNLGEAPYRNVAKTMVTQARLCKAWSLQRPRSTAQALVQVEG